MAEPEYLAATPPYPKSQNSDGSDYKIPIPRSDPRTLNWRSSARSGYGDRGGLLPGEAKDIMRK